jgi:uncharacterized damage-inducible protein DinB
MLTRDDYLYFADRALIGMSDIVIQLGNERANQRAYRGANTPYALLHHCLEVIEAWVGSFMRGRPLDRNRDAEFTVSGSPDALVLRCEEVRKRLHVDVARADLAAELVNQPPESYEGPSRLPTQASALQHVYEELAQHHGQMQVLRDLLTSEEHTGDTGAR